VAKKINIKPWHIGAAVLATGGAAYLIWGRKSTKETGVPAPRALPAPPPITIHIPAPAAPPPPPPAAPGPQPEAELMDYTDRQVAYMLSRLSEVSDAIDTFIHHSVNVAAAKEYSFEARDQLLALLDDLINDTGGLHRNVTLNPVIGQVPLAEDKVGRLVADVHALSSSARGRMRQAEATLRDEMPLFHGALIWNYNDATGWYEPGLTHPAR